MRVNGSSPVTLQDCKALDLLATTVCMLDQDGMIRWVNNAGQSLLKRSSRSLEGMAAKNLFEDDQAFEHAFEAILHGEFSSFGLMGSLIQNQGQEKLLVSATLQRLEQQAWSVILEVREIEQHTLAERNERLIKELEIHQETFRNLGHEVKNPLGGLRGAAQLLEMELSDPALQEYTRVIIAEAASQIIQFCVNECIIQEPTKIFIGKLDVCFSTFAQNFICCILKLEKSIIG